MAGQRTGNRIVVGVDGSPSSLAALRWAARQAELSGAELHAVTAWHVPGTGTWVAPVADFDWASNAGTILDQAIKEALDGTGTDRVHRHVVQGPSAAVLLDAAEGADLLVVGSRGHGEFAGMLLGSVAQHVTAHAPCPVLVVRTRPDADEPSPHD